MRIDAHQHFWRYTAAEYDWIDASMASLRRDFLPPEARSEMDRAGVDGCVVVQARQTLEETQWLLGLSDAHPFITGVVGWVDLRADDVRRQLEGLSRHRKLVGVRHILQAEADDRFMLRSDFCRGVALLEHFNLAYDILIFPKHLPAAAELVSRFPHVRFVLDHLAKPDVRAGAIREWAPALRRLAAFPNVFAKLSGLVTEADWWAWTDDQIRPYLDVEFDCFGADRLLAGSDWPVCTLAAEYRRTIAMIDQYLADRPAFEREGVMGGNAVRCWDLQPGELA